MGFPVKTVSSIYCRRMNSAAEAVFKVAGATSSSDSYCVGFGESDLQTSSFNNCLVRFGKSRKSLTTRKDFTSDLQSLVTWGK